jgi:hypothetical protein
MSKNNFCFPILREIKINKKYDEEQKINITEIIILVYRLDCDFKEFI